MIEKQPPVLNTLSREITRRLTRRIVDDVYPANTKLPTERELAAEFGVTRHVVREALKRLEALGLVTIRQGSGILVQDLQMTGGMELMRSLITREDGTLDGPFVSDLLDFRAQIGQNVVRLAASNRTEEELAQIKALIMERRLYANDPVKLNAINARILKAFAMASHNRIYRMVLNSVGGIVIELRANLAIPPDVAVQVQSLLEQIIAAVELQDAEMAGLLARRHSTLMRNECERIVRGEP